MRRTIALLLSAMALSGCGLMRASSDKPELTVRPLDNGQIDPATPGAEALATGRDAMRGGNLMAAMTAFRIAQRDPATAAEAINGMGVAWATMGRSDLAEKLFIEAAALEPRDRRFAANLERVLAQKVLPAVPTTESYVQSAAAAPQRMAPARPLIGAVQVQRPRDALMRVSRTEVRIGGANRPQTLSQPVAAAMPEQAPGQPVIRVALPRAGDRVYPLRVALPARAPVAAVQTRTGVSYPLRVALRPNRTADYPVRVRLPTQSTDAE